MRLTQEQRRSIEAWMAERQKSFGMTRKPTTEAWFEYRSAGGVRVSLAQFYAISLYARCTGVLRLWRGRRVDGSKQLLLPFPDA